MPVVPCPRARFPERVGVWQSDDWALVYDGCTVAFQTFLNHDPPIITGLRCVGGSTYVNVVD